MSREPDVVVLREALSDIAPTSAGAAERPGGSPASVPRTAPARAAANSLTPEDPQHTAALKESA